MNLNTPYNVIDVIHDAASRNIDKYNSKYEQSPLSTFMCNVIQESDVEDLIQRYVCVNTIALVSSIANILNENGYAVDEEDEEDDNLYEIVKIFWNDFVENKKLWSDDRIVEEYEALK